MIDRVVIYEVHYSNVNRYVIPLAQHFLEAGLTDNVTLAYDSFVEHDKITRPEDPRIQLKSVKRAHKEVERGSSTVFITYSYRVVDLYWTHRFKEKGAFTAQIQHGMYAEFLERSFLGYFSAFPRKMTFLRYTLSFLLRGKTTIFKYLVNKDFLKSFKVNESLERNKAKITPIVSDHVFVWGDYWKDWFVKNHFYKDTDSFTTIGNPDYHKFIRGKRTQHQAEKVCYIAQTFVEDGRMVRSELKKTIDFLADSFKERLVVKLHPRSDKEIYGKVIANGGELTMGFPFTGYYLGHYSSLLALAINEGQVFLLEINNEDIPTYFRNSANKVYPETGIKSLVSDVNEGKKFGADTDISYYFQNKEQHPFEIITGQISVMV